MDTNDQAARDVASHSAAYAFADVAATAAEKEAAHFADAAVKARAKADRIKAELVAAQAAMASAKSTATK
jgi:hypothetical protein